MLLHQPGKLFPFLVLCLLFLVLQVQFLKSQVKKTRLYPVGVGGRGIFENLELGLCLDAHKIKA